MIANLPQGSAFYRALSGGWTQVEATTAEIMHETFRAVAGLGGVTVEPLVFERPTSETVEEPERRSDVSGFTAALRAAIGGGTGG